MSEIGKFIAFQAVISLLVKTNQEDLIEAVYESCRAQLEKAPEAMENHVQRLYDAFSTEVITKEIARLVYPKHTNGWSGEIEMIFQSITSLHQAIPEHKGDWYFTGNYPTPGGYAVLNKAFINFYEQKGSRSY